MIDSVFSLWKADTPGGQVLVRQHGETVYERCFGLAEMQNRVPVTEDSVFLLASVSKQFTVLAVALLWEQGIIDIDKEVGEYLPEVGPFPGVTLRRMLHNVSGLRDQWELLFFRGVRFSDHITMDDLLEAITEQKQLNFAPGERYMYSNSNFTLLAAAAERVTGKRWKDLLSDLVFKPAGLEHTYLKDDAGQIMPAAVYAYHDNGDGSFSYTPITFSLYGPTSVISNARDLARMLEIYRTGTVFPSKALGLLFERPALSDGTVSGYGGGLQFGVHNGRAYYGHGGVDSGYRAEVMTFPEEELDIIVLANTDNVVPKEACLRISDMLLGTEFPARPAVEGQFPPDGTWHAEDIEAAMQLTVKDGAVERLGHSIPLKALEDGWFQLGYLGEYITYSGGRLLYRPGLRSYELKKVERASDVSLIGTYVDKENKTYLKIASKDGALFLTRFRFGEVPLFELEKDVLCFDLDDDLPSRLRVLRSDGRPAGFFLSSGRARNMLYGRLTEGR